MDAELLDVVPLWVLFAATTGSAMLALEGGYRLGRWRHARTAEEKEAPVGAMVGATLGLLAFLLAFAFGQAAGRFDARREAVLQEANAVGTAYLRTRLLPEPHRAASARLLREYVDVRLAGARGGPGLAPALARSEELHGALWDEAVRATEARPTPITGLYVQALNDVIDMHAKRVQAGLRSRVPTAIWVGLFALAALGMASVGYQAGLSGTRRSPAMPALVAAFAGVLLLIADLDRPQEGLLRISQQGLVDVQRSMTGP